MELLTRTPATSSRTAPVVAPDTGYPGGAATPADHVRMRVGAAAFAEAAALASTKSALLDGLRSTFEGGLAVVDALRANYPEPAPEWVTWEAQARAGGDALRDLLAKHPVESAPHELLATVRSGALAGAQLLTAWDG